MNLNRFPDNNYEPRAASPSPRSRLPAADPLPDPELVRLQNELAPLMRVMRTEARLSSLPGLQRVEAQLTDFDVTAPQMFRALVDMSATPLIGVPSRAPGPNVRRLVLGCMIGVRLGLAREDALNAVDHARTLDRQAVDKFLAEELAVMSSLTLQGYGCYLVGGKATASMSAKALVYKSAGAGVSLAKGKAAAVFFGWAGVLAAAGLWGSGLVVNGFQAAETVWINNPDALFLLQSRDERIVEVLLREGRIHREQT